MTYNYEQNINILEWLGHANFAIAADVYSHLDFSAIEQSASVISNALTSKEENIDEEIEELEKQLEEKRRKKREKDFEM